MEQKMLSKKGFSIVEMMLAIGIFAFIFAGVVGAFLGSQRSWSVAEAKIRGNEQLSLTLGRIARELRHTASTPAEIAADNASIKFQVPIDDDSDGIYDRYLTSGDLIWGADNIENYQINYFLDNGNLIRAVSNAAGDEQSRETIAGNITQLSFSANDRLNPDYITVEITMELKGVKTTKRVNVAVKN